MVEGATDTHNAHDVVVVGGGIAGLVAAIDLHRAGRRVVVYEAAPEVGGRVRSTVIDGCTIDHGFQVLFTAYPTLNQYLDHSTLALQRFRPAARIVRTPNRGALIGDAMRDWSLLWPSLTSGALGWRDLLRLRTLRATAMRRSVASCIEDSALRSMRTREYLHRAGFSDEAIHRFFAPFYGGILLDRSLSTRASVLLFTFKMLSEGDTAVPAAGMGAIPQQMAALLPAESVRCNHAVRAIHVEHGSVCGVVLADGSTVRAPQVVLATDAPRARDLAASVRLTLAEPERGLGCTTVYYRSRTELLPGRALWLNALPPANDSADEGHRVSHAVTLSDVAPSYAPQGTRLVGATILGDHSALSDDTLDAVARRDLARMSPLQPNDRRVRVIGTDMQRVAIMRIPFAQYAQPVETEMTVSHARASGDAPANTHEHARTPLPGLFRASEVLHSSSLEGAARGGQMAARACTS